MSKRREPRVEIDRPIDIQSSRGVSRGVVRDFSPGGCCIHRTDARVHCGMQLTLRICLPDRIEPMEIKPATVTWTHNSVFGVEFLRPSQEIRSRLKQVYDQLLEAQTEENRDQTVPLPRSSGNNPRNHRTPSEDTSHASQIISTASRPWAPAFKVSHRSWKNRAGSAAARLWEDAYRMLRGICRQCARAPRLKEPSSSREATRQKKFRNPFNECLGKEGLLEIGSLSIYPVRH